MDKKKIKEKNTQGVFPSVPSVNFHLWEACNMRCKFCFATFQDIPKNAYPKRHLAEADAIAVVERIARFGFQKITFAGGEPLLCPWLVELIAAAKRGGMTTMVVTNAYYLDQQWVDQIGNNLDWVAISIDSLDEDINLNSGRAHIGKKVLYAQDYLFKIQLLRQAGIKFKMNTVVHRQNLEEDMNDFIKMAHPERWKILQALPVKGQNDNHIEDLLISENQFNTFLERHQSSKNFTTVVPETNEAITGSYVMVDPLGRFFDNTEGEHRYSLPILEVGVAQAMAQVHVDSEKFEARGGRYDWKNL